MQVSRDNPATDGSIPASMKTALVLDALAQLAQMLTGPGTGRRRHRAWVNVLNPELRPCREGWATWADGAVEPVEVRGGSHGSMKRDG
ncbi:hypothetical protein [Pseudonocardia sp.]|uniref:hypothetical protein n=1 Tax=Pseudonocardia sp. TaxID=60912 RepID=UPI0031FBCDEA